MIKLTKEECPHCGEELDQVDYSYMIEYIKTEISKAGTQKAFAKKIGFSPTFIADVLVGDRNLTENLLYELGFMRLDRFMKMKCAK